MQTVIAVLGAIVVCIFGCGVFWANLNEKKLQKYDSYSSRIDDLIRQMDDLKANLGDLGALSSPSYQTEATNDESAGRCEESNVVTGVRYDHKEGQLCIRCASFGRAAWRPSETPARSMQ